MSGHSARREKTQRLQVVGYGVYAGKPDGILHGVVGGRLCGVLVVWAGALSRYRDDFFRSVFSSLSTGAVENILKKHSEIQINRHSVVPNSLYSTRANPGYTLAIFLRSS